MNRFSIFFISILGLLNACSFSETYKEDGIIAGHGYVDLGLSVLWANCNIGAETPFDAGSKFAWAETVANTNERWKTYEVYDCLKESDDAARVLWGKGWRVPTKTEVQELLDNCKFELRKTKTYQGVKVTGPNGRFIFIPFTEKDREAIGGTKLFAELWSDQGDKLHTFDILHDSAITLYIGHTYNEYIKDFNIFSSFSSMRRKYNPCEIRPVCNRISIK